MQQMWTVLQHVGPDHLGLVVSAEEERVPIEVKLAVLKSTLQVLLQPLWLLPA